MAITVNGNVVAEVTEDWGVTFTSTDGLMYVIPCDDEADARAHAMMFGGEVSRCTIYRMPWVKRDDDS